jgi:hypothetical protein
MSATLQYSISICVQRRPAPARYRLPLAGPRPGTGRETGLAARNVPAYRGANDEF